MRKIFLLAKVLLKSGGMFFSKSKRTKWLLPAVLAFAVFSFASSMIMITFDLYDSFSASGVEDMIMPLAFGATSVVVFIFGIFYVVSTMYHANDIELLMYLPLRPYHILGAKFITLVVYEYIMETLILVPILIAFGIKSGAGALYIIYSAILFLIVPVIALSMASIIVMVVMRFTNFGKNKQAFKFAGGIIAILFALGINVVIQNSVTNVSQEQLIAIASGQSSLTDIMSNIFPGIRFAANTLIYSTSLEGLWNLLLFILCSGGAVLVFIGIGQLIYLPGVSGVTETSAKRKEIRDVGKRTASTPVVRSYMKKEIRLLFRSPIAFLNCILVNLIWPVIVIIMLTSRGESMSAISGYISKLDRGLLLSIIVGASAFLSSANAITSTAISREGRTLYFMKYIPVPIQKQLQAKTVTGMIFSLIGVVLIVAVSVFLGVNIITALIALVVGVAAMAAGSMAGLLIDVANPKLNWMNEQQAIKQNVNVLLHMLLGVVFGAVAIVPVLLIHISWIPAILYNVVVFGLLAAILFNRVNRYAVSKIEEMDV